MTTSTHSHKAWTDKGGHVTGAEDHQWRVISRGWRFRSRAGLAKQRRSKQAMALFDDVMGQHIGIEADHGCNNVVVSTSLGTGGMLAFGRPKLLAAGPSGLELRTGPVPQADVTPYPDRVSRRTP